MRRTSYSNHQASPIAAVSCSLFKHRRHRHRMECRAVIRTLGAANFTKGLVAGNLNGFGITVANGTVAVDGSAVGATGVHEFAQGSGGVMAVQKVVGLGPTGNLLGQDALLIDLEEGEEEILCEPSILLGYFWIKNSRVTMVCTYKWHKISIGNNIE